MDLLGAVGHAVTESARKLIGAIITMALLVLVVRYPADIAGWVTGTAHLLIRIVNGLVTFARQIGGH